MPMRKGKCIQFGLCPRADSKDAVQVEAGQDFVCPECAKPLQEAAPGRGGRVPLGVVAGAIAAVVLSAAGGYWYVASPGSATAEVWDEFKEPSPAGASTVTPTASEAVTPARSTPCSGIEAVASPDVNRVLIYLKQGVNYAAQGKYEDALKEFSQIRAIDPNFLAMQENAAGAEIKLKRWDDAARDLDAEVRLIGCLQTLHDEQLVPFAYMVEAGPDGPAAGVARAQAMRARLSQALAVAHYNRACLHAASGRTADGLVALRQAVDSGFSDMNAMRRDPDLAALRGEADYRRLLAEVSSVSR